MPCQNKEAELAYYNRFGPELQDEFPESLYERWLRASGLWDSAPQEILEAACGSGHFGHRLARRGHRVTGVDLSSVMAELANAKAPAGFHAQAGDLEDASLFPRGRFDTVFFGQALHHFPDIRPVVANAFTWLKPGGRMVAIEPNGSNPVNRLGKSLGRLLALHPGMRKAIGTVNEVSIPVGRAVRTLRREGFRMVLEQMEAEFPSETGEAQIAHLPWLLQALGACREGLYTLCLKTLPPRFSGVQFLVIAQKPPAGA